MASTRRSSRPTRVGRGPPNLRPRVGRPRRAAAPSLWRDRSRRRCNRSQGRSDAWLNGANPCPQAGQRSSRRLPWRAQAIVVARRHSLRKYGCSSSARHCGQNCSQAACRRPRRPGERSARNGNRSARAPAPASVMPPTAPGVRPVQRTSRSRTLAGSARSSRSDQAPELKIERRSERPGRQAVANGQPMQPAREQFIGLWTRDDRPMTRQEVVGYGVELRLRATRNPSTSSQQSLAQPASRAGRKRDMRERLDRRRCDPLGAIPHGLGRRPRDDPDDLADQPFGQGEDRARSSRPKGAKPGPAARPLQDCREGQDSLRHDASAARAPARSGSPSRRSD